ncbi:hypothetical protein CVT24_007273 [Panaeolus cyanescens]|uniref:SHSP domain-containing protein n=1 Tax=Panaeolus cyanescens TaxID=181874 RepID=A0A409VJ35_9AGAR|nr:hypothetical protein CVT24_007273 [Panaeolus cyanescens]
MSLARQFFREMRPFFRMLDEPFGNPSHFYRGAYAVPPTRNDLFQDIDVFNRPAVDISDQGDKYVVDADLPGVKKENIEVRVGDDGRSITIEGKVVDSSQVAQMGMGSKDTTASTTPSDSTSQAVTASTDSTQSALQLSNERPFRRNVTFTRTVWLPRPVDPQNVKAKLENGVLNIAINKAQDKRSTVIEVD